MCVCVCVCSVTQSFPTLCDPMNYSPPGFSVYGILQARIVKWVAISSSRGSSLHRVRTQVSFIAGEFFTTALPGKPSRMYEPLSINVLSFRGSAEAPERAGHFLLNAL